MVKGVLGEQRRGGWDEARSRRTATRSQVHAYSTSVTSLVQFPSFPHLLIPPRVHWQTHRSVSHRVFVDVDVAIRCC